MSKTNSDHLYSISISDKTKTVRDNEFSNTLFNMLDSARYDVPIHIKVQPDDYTRREITYIIGNHNNRIYLPR